MLPSHYLPERTELFAMQQGVLLAQEMELSNVIFETDALSVIQAISHDLSGSEMGHLIQGIQLAKASFNSCSFHHLERDYRVAHELAQFDKCNHANQTWEGCFSTLCSSSDSIRPRLISVFAFGFCCTPFLV
ncbi:uncharacterized protein LOC115986680 [Quercus lobata]|uniref:uncharacterized protein LOC115986680 n=1 Tax=Quercus lobata TaxID=97700 RepID=UPI001247A5E6|nr:uncharacterized protein LOC115986680 [Quercus lobata]